MCKNLFFTVYGKNKWKAWARRSLLSTSACSPVASVVAMQPWTALSMMTRKYQQKINWFLALALALLLDIFMEMRNKNSPCTAMISCSAELSMLLRKGQSWSVGFCHMTCGALEAFWKVEMFSSRRGIGAPGKTSAPRCFHYERARRAPTLEITNLSAKKTQYVNGP